jgi:DNA (cytosine-5)-methyltransferase 1
MTGAEDRVAERPTAIDLFAGAGGLSLGLEQAGFDVLAAVDNDPVHALTYRYNFPSTEVLCQDVTRLSASSIVAAAREGADRLGRTWDGEVDCLAGGPSCQGFSVIGPRDPADPRNTLVFEFARLVSEIQPRYFLLENVPGLLGTSYRSIYAELAKVLRAAGYDLGDVPWTLDAYDFGVPQRRRRVFLIGTHRGLPAPSRPVESAHISSSEAIGDLATLTGYPTADGSDEITLSGVQATALMAVASAYVRRLRGQGDPLDFSAPRRWEASRLSGAAGTRHGELVCERFEALKHGEREPSSKLTRLDPGRPSPTLRAGTGRDHGSHTSVRPVHYSSPRVITVREAARLHSFPDWFRFHTARWHALRQIGNSVPPALARAVGLSIASALGVTTPGRRPAQDLGNPADLEASLSKAAMTLEVPSSQLPPPRRSCGPRSVVAPPQ